MAAIARHGRQLHGGRGPRRVELAAPADRSPSRRTSMSTPPWLWAVFTLVAAAGQTARNAMQRELTTRLGTVGATHVRFLFGFPFSVLFLSGVLLVTGRS